MCHSCRNDTIIHVFVLQLGHHVLQNGTVTALTCVGGSTYRDNEVGVDVSKSIWVQNVLDGKLT